MSNIKSLFGMLTGFAKGRLRRKWHGIDNDSAESYEDDLTDKVVAVAGTLREMGGFGAYFTINTFLPDGSMQFAPANIGEFITRLAANSQATHQAMREGVYATAPELEEGITHLDVAVRDLSEFWNRRDRRMDVLSDAVLTKMTLYRFIRHEILPEGSQIVFSERNFALYFPTKEGIVDTIILELPGAPAPALP